jgi:prepilin signal peptidase PulO-like enzyme (type II secretory pathway)
MSPETIFQIANPVALIGWLALIATPLAPRITNIIASTIIPLLLATAYTALILAFWSSAPGGFGTLAQVMALFTAPHLALAGWLHYLAFDLFIGAWAVRTARAEHIPHLLTLPALALIFLFGPAGLLTFSALRAAYDLKGTT